MYTILKQSSFNSRQFSTNELDWKLTTMHLSLITMINIGLLYELIT